MVRKFGTGGNTMKNVAVITGADRGLGLALCEKLLAEGWLVFAGQFMDEWKELDKLRACYPDTLEIVTLDVSSLKSVKEAAKKISRATNNVDMLINNAGISGWDGDIRGEMNFSISQNTFNINSLGPIRMVENILPLMDKGMKRLCFISSEAGSISACLRSSNYGYCMSKTALNMAIKIMFNDLHQDGYTFRIYHPGWLRSYMGGKKSTIGDLDPEDSAAVAVPFFVEDSYCEDRLVMIDNKGVEWPF